MKLVSAQTAEEKRNQITDIKKGKVNTNINNFNLDVVEEESQNEDLDESKQSNYVSKESSVRKPESRNEKHEYEKVTD